MKGRVGIIIGLPSERVPGNIQLSIEEIRMINIRLLTPEELQFVIENGSEGRNKLAEEMIRDGNPTVSFLNRRSLR